MILYVDSESKVRAVNSTTDTSLTPLYVDESNDTFPFKELKSKSSPFLVLTFKSYILIQSFFLLS